MRIEFADCMLDVGSFRLHKAGQPATIEPQVFELLYTLVRNAGRIVTKDDLIDAEWSGRIVSDAAISSRVSAVRTAVGDNGKDQAIIRTVSRRGFQLVADVTVLDRGSDGHGASGQLRGNS